VAAELTSLGTCKETCHKDPARIYSPAADTGHLVFKEKARVGLTLQRDTALDRCAELDQLICDENKARLTAPRVVFQCWVVDL
jgi:hypothetical protein